MILFMVAPGFSAPSDTTVSPDGSITVPTVSAESSLAFISRPAIDILSFSVTRTLTMASCHLRTISRAAARLSLCADASVGTAISSAGTSSWRILNFIEPPSHLTSSTRSASRRRTSGYRAARKAL